MNTDEIAYALRDRCDEQFLGVFAADQLPVSLPPQRPLLLVCNTDPINKSGRHWVCIRVDVIGEYFDSLGESVPIAFSRFLDRFCGTWIASEKRLQSVISYYCGHYCIFYCLYRSIGYTLRDILDCFSSDTGLNDYMAHTFVCRGIM
jgi:hypothetical protein